MWLLVIGMPSVNRHYLVGHLWRRWIHVEPVVSISVKFPWCSHSHSIFFTPKESKKAVWHPLQRGTLIMGKSSRYRVLSIATGGKVIFRSSIAPESSQIGGPCEYVFRSWVPEAHVQWFWDPPFKENPHWNKHTNPPSTNIDVEDLYLSKEV